MAAIRSLTDYTTRFRGFSDFNFGFNGHYYYFIIIILFYNNCDGQSPCFHAELRKLAKDYPSIPSRPH